MADTLPVDTTSPAIAALTPPIARLDVPLAELEAALRKASAIKTPESQFRAGELAELYHCCCDLNADSPVEDAPPGAVYGSYLQLGGQS